MTSRPRVRAASIPALALVAILVGACGSTAPSQQPPSQAPSTPAPTAAASPAATATPGPTPVGSEAPRGELVIGCMSVEEAECRFVAQQIVAQLPPERGPPFAVELQLFQCENPAAPCPKSLSARNGKAVIEFLDGGEPMDFTVTGPPLTPTITAQDGFYLGLTNPSSPRIGGPGPVPYELGHCGATHVIDFDGSFWLPLGQVDGDHPSIINADTGTMRFLAPNVAEFRGDTGFILQLARFPGPKHFWGCD